MIGDASLPLSMEVLGYAVGLIALDILLSVVWCEGGFDARLFLKKKFSQKFVQCYSLKEV